MLCSCPLELLSLFIIHSLVCMTYLLTAMWQNSVLSAGDRMMTKTAKDLHLVMEEVYSNQTNTEI